MSRFHKVPSRGVIFVTHDQEEANTTSDRIAVINSGVVEQIGTPMYLYDQPGNLFVANFLGVTNVIEGKIEEENGKAVFLSSDGAVTVPITGKDKGSSNIVFRPQNLTIQARNAKAVLGSMRLEGTVEHIEFLGGVVRYRVTVGKSFLLVDAPHQLGEKVMPLETEVSLYLNTDQIIKLSN